MNNQGENASDITAIANAFGDYELLEQIGRGGMGVVYRARQRSLDRVVAIKMMAFGPGASPEFIERFHAEAVSAASLHHPNIVAIHEVGIHEGWHFLVMDYIEGQTLAGLAGNQPLPPRRAAAYLGTVAEAVHYAHEHGILHRDLKPSNVLIDAQDQPHVVDFGLARRLEGDSELTVTGQVLGSPHYLPPEQATGQRARVSRRTDVYGLGATLYHLLTGRPLFQAESLAQTLDLVLHADPVAPRLLNPGVPHDLETICLKCMEKEPSRRYATAQALADELACFQEGEPIQARPLGAVGKTWRWCRRKPQVAILAAMAVLLFLLGFAGVLWQWRRAETQRQRAEAGELAARQQAYVSEINAAQAALKANNPGRALELLNRHRPANKAEKGKQKAELDLRGFEWRYLWQRCQTEAEDIVGWVNGGVRSLEVSPDGRWLVAGSETGVVSLWNFSTREEIVLTAGRSVRAFAAFSPDSRLLLFTDQTQEALGKIAVWDLEARKRLATIRNPNPIGPIAFSSDGKWLGLGVIVSLQARGVEILDARTYAKHCEQVTDTGVTEDMRHGIAWVFVPDHSEVIFTENDPDRRIRLWDFSTDRAPAQFPGHGEAITALAISPNGRILATGAGWTDKIIKLWEVPSFRPLGDLVGHTGWIAALRFSPDSQTLASASADQTIRVWDMHTQKTTRVFRGLAAPAWRLCFAPDGQKLFSGSSDGTIQRWPIEALISEQETGFRRIQTQLNSVVVAPDAKHFGGIRQGRASMGEIRSPAPAGETVGLGTNVSCLLFSSDGQTLFAGTEGGEVKMWSLSGPPVLRSLRGQSEPVWELRQDRAGRILVVLQAKRALVWLPYHVAVWSTRNWQQQTSFEFSASESARAVSPDGRWLATGRYGGPVRLWNLANPSQTNTLAISGEISGLAFSPDGRLLAAVRQEGIVKVWELPSCRELHEFQAGSQALFGLAFSPDSRRLAVAGDGDAAIKLWDTATWEELITFSRPGETIHRPFFSTDGNELVVQNSKGDLLIWSVPSFAEIEAKERTVKGQ